MRIVAMALIAATLFAETAFAQDFPALYDVIRVRPDDRLNVRSLPGRSGRVVGGLDSDATGIEITGLNPSGTWGRVNLEEGVGWVSMAFLERQAGQDDGFPDVAACYGTEPFWNLTRTDSGLVFKSLNGIEGTLTERWSGQPARRDRKALIATAAPGRMTAVISRQECSDGMSDRIYGFGIDIVAEFGPEPVMWSGCCSLSR